MMITELICPKCNTPMAVIKAIPKDTRLITVNRCPNCKNKTKTIFEFNNKDIWMNDVGEAFFKCDLCGEINKDNIAGYTYLGGYGYRSSWHGYSQTKKIVFRCKGCNEKRVKVTTGDYWAQDLEPFGRAEKKEPVKIDEPPKELTCPKCGEPISEADDVCKKCGLELICDKCGEPLVSGSNFCPNCGDKVETFKVEEEIPPESGLVCPACQEQLTEDQIYCDRCGQEVKCDKCGARLLEGASFCRECGDPVVQGEFGI
jgi:predicted RNA-binding Zn-ribbon protein involved in translation (DUF1610 family)